jgi:hypothetical protein
MHVASPTPDCLTLTVSGPFFGLFPSFRYVFLKPEDRLEIYYRNRLTRERGLEDLISVERVNISSDSESTWRIQLRFASGPDETLQDYNDTPKEIADEVRWFVGEETLDRREAQMSADKILDAPGGFFPSRMPSELRELREKMVPLEAKCREMVEGGGLYGLMAKGLLGAFSAVSVDAEVNKQMDLGRKYPDDVNRLILLARELQARERYAEASTCLQEARTRFAEQGQKERADRVASVISKWSAVWPEQASSTL